MSWRDTIKPVAPEPAATPAESGWKATIAPATEPAGNSPNWKSTIKSRAASDEADEILATPKGEWQPQQITPEELAEISKRTGTSIDKLKSAAAFFTGGVPVKGEDQSVAGAAAGLAGRVGRVALSLPQAIYKKLVADDKDERALDILDALARKKQSYVADIFDIAGSIPLGTGVYKGATAALEAAGTAIPKAAPYIAAGPLAGAAAGLGSSEKGSELQDAATGAAIGSVFTVAPQVVGKIADQAKKYVAAPLAAKVEKELRANQKPLEELFQSFAKENAENINAISKGLQTTKLDSFEKFVESATPQFRKELEASSNKIPKELVAKFIAKNKLTDAVEPDLRAYLAAKQLDNQFKKQFGTSVRQIQGRVKPEQFDEMYKDLLRKDLYAQNVNAITSKWSPAKKFAYQGLNYLSASKPTAMLLDDLYGTTAERTLDDMAANYNLKYARPMQQIAPLYSKASATADDQMGKLIEAGDSSPKTEAVRKYFADVRELANELGAAIPKAPNYFPKMKLPPAEMANAIREKFKQVSSQIDLAKASPAEFKQIVKDVPEVGELYKVVKGLSDSNVTDGQQLINATTTLISSPQELRTGLSKVLSASLAAGEESIPDWARDWNTRRVMSRWASNTFKSIALGDGIRRLGVLEQAMRKAKDTSAANFYKNAREDLLGGKKGTLAAAVRDVMQRREERLDTLANKATTDLGRQYYNTLKELPQLGNWFKNWTYATLLGGRVKPALQNITSAYLQNAGDIGYARAQRYLAESSMDIADLVQQGKLTKFVQEEVYDRGLVAPGWRGEMDALVSGKASKGKIASALSGLDEKTRDLVTSVFTMSEITARALTASMGKKLSKDLMTDPKLQQQFIGSLPSPSYKRSIAKALQSGELQTVEDEVIRYMNATNMFNYQSFSQSQFVRDMGPAFSMFTLWPSMALGRVAKDFVTSGGTKASARLASTVGVPFLALGAIDLALSGTDIRNTPQYQLAFGKSSLADQTLLSAFPTNIEGRSGLISAPIPGAVIQSGKALSGLIEQDPKEAEKLARDAARTFVPYVSIYNKFVKDQLPLLKGELPEK
jgi:hypothetical protein